MPRQEWRQRVPRRGYVVRGLICCEATPIRTLPFMTMGRLQQAASFARMGILYQILQLTRRSATVR